MRYFRFCAAASLCFGLVGCGDDMGAALDDRARAEAADPQVTTTTAASTRTTTSTQLPATTLATDQSPDLSPLFTFLGEKAWAIEAIGYDEPADQYVVYTKNGEGGPGIEYVDEAPEFRLALELVDDGGGPNLEESHAIAGDWTHPLDVYWNGHGITDVRSITSGADVLLGRRALRLHFGPYEDLIFEDVTDSASPNNTHVLRSHRLDVDGEVTENWAVEFDANILFSMNIEAGVLVATTSPDDPFGTSIDEIHIVNGRGRIARSIDAPEGLLWIQIPVEYSEDLQPCRDTVVLGTNNAIEWDIDTSYNLLTACRDGRPISTTQWCCGMSEYSGAIDSNGDGIDEIFVGGTSVGGAGGGIYSLVDGVLAPIRTEDGAEMYLFTGDIGGSIGDYGCRDGLFVQVETSAQGRSAWATRTFYRFDGHRATIVDEERIEWPLDFDIDEIAQGIWEVHYSAPPEMLNDLFDCSIPERIALPGTDGLSIFLLPQRLSNARSCEVEWPRPYSQLGLVGRDRSQQIWEPPAGEEIAIQWIAEPEDFIATEDGRFALLDYFVCSHEGETKTIYVGRYDPSNGQLLEWDRIEPPEDFVYADDYYRRHPDRLVINESGDIIGELDTRPGTLELVLSPS